MNVRANVVGVSWSLHPSPSSAVPVQALTDVYVPIALLAAGPFSTISN